MSTIVNHPMCNIAHLPRSAVHLLDRFGVVNSYLPLLVARQVTSHWQRLALILASMAGITQGATYVNRVGPQDGIRDVIITASTTWTTVNSPYIVEARLTIAQGTTLSVEPGTIVQIAANQGLYANGVIVARQATFAINGSGNWAGLYLSPASGASTLEGSTFSQAGANLGYLDWANRHTAIYVDRCAPTITGCSFINQSGNGVELISSAAIIKNNVFTNLGEGCYAIVFNTLDAFPVLAGNTVSGTGVQGIAVPGGRLSGTNIWNKPGLGFPYFINGDLTLGAGVQLTVEAGVQLKMLGNRIWVDGTLQARGTADEPVVFTSQKNEPKPGDWRGLYFGPGAGESQLRYCLLSFGGDNLGYINWANRPTTIYVDQSSPTFDNITLTYSQYHGLWFNSSHSEVHGANIQFCGGHGLIAEGSSRINLGDTSFAHNGTADDGFYTVLEDASSIVAPLNVTFSENRRQGINISGGTLATDGTWKHWATNAPYVLTGEVTVVDKVRLTIEAGTTMKLQNTRLVVSGVLIADGMADAITLTSWRDDRIGGNSDGTNSLPAEGDWKGIYLSPNSSGSVIRNCQFNYGGNNIGYINWDNRLAFIYLDQCSPTIQNCTFAHSAGHGIELYSSAALVQTNSFVDMAENNYAVALDLTDRFPILTDNQASGRGIRGVAVPGGNISGSQAWTKPGRDFPYFLNGQLTIPAQAQLSLAAGIKILSSNQKIWVDGTLQALGQATNPIVFSSRNSTPAPGDWRGVYLGPGAGGSVLRYCTLTFGGNLLEYLHWADRYTTIFVDSSSPTFDHVTVGNSLWHGVWFYSSSSQTDGLRIEHCGGNAMLAELGSRPSLINPVFVGNGLNSDSKTTYYTVSMDSSCVPDPIGATFITNRWQGVELRGGALATSGLWKDWAPNAPYVATADLTIVAGATLTIEPNTTVKFNGAGLYVNGVLNADGSAGPIHFTSWLDDQYGSDLDGSPSFGTSNSWKGIYLSPQSSASVLNHCTISFTGARLGYINWADRYPAVYVDGCSPTIGNCIITDAGSHGIEFHSSSAILHGTTFTNLAPAAYAIMMDTLDRFPNVRDCVGLGSGLHGIAVPGGQLGAASVWTKPGNSFPYYVNGELSLAAGNQLVIEPGVIVKSDGFRLVIAGTLSVQGTGSERVTFTSRKPLPARGDWPGLYFGPTAGDSTMYFCDVLYSGAGMGNIHWQDRFTGIYLDHCSPSFHNLVVSQGAGYGLELESSSALIEGSLIFNNAWSNVRLSNGSSPRIINNTIVQSDAAGIDCASGSPTIANNILAFNATSGFRYETGAPILQNNCVAGNSQSNYFNWAAGASDIASDPQFEALADGDFHLSPGSPCLNAGDVSVVEPAWMDLDGRARIDGATVELGAYEFGASSEWSVTTTGVTPTGNRSFLGQFGNTNILLTVSHLPVHDAITISFDLFVIRSWDGNSTTDGPDIWELNVVGGAQLCHASFNNGPDNSRLNGQSFPDGVGLGVHAAFTGAVETNSLGYFYQGKPMDAVYRMSYTVAHTSDTMTLSFLARGLNPNLAEESWGLANVQVKASTMPPTFELTAKRPSAPGKFELRLTGVPQHTYVIEASTNYRDWTPVSTNFMTTETWDTTDPEAGKYLLRFYRACEK
jgi:hypothetical protein